MGPRLLWLTPLAMLLGCSPLVRFEGTVIVEGVESPTADRLHVAASCNPSQPAGAPWVQPFASYSAKPNSSGDGLVVILHCFGARATLDVRFWYDGDGDGVPGAADRSGKIATPIVGEDRGLLQGNLTRFGPLRIADVPENVAPPSP